MKKLLVLVLVSMFMSCSKEDEILFDEYDYKKNWTVDFVVKYVAYRDANMHNNDVEDNGDVLPFSVHLYSVDSVDFKSKYVFNYQDQYFDGIEPIDKITYLQYMRHNNDPYVGQIVTIEFDFNDKYYQSLGVNTEDIMRYFELGIYHFNVINSMSSNHIGKYNFRVVSNDTVTILDEWRK